MVLGKLIIFDHNNQMKLLTVITISDDHYKCLNDNRNHLYLNLRLLERLDKVPFHERPFPLEAGLVRGRRLPPVFGLQVGERRAPAAGQSGTWRRKPAALKRKIKIMK
jgi:hypothetical protein